jgi:hypothetical protein
MVCNDKQFLVAHEVHGRSLLRYVQAASAPTLSRKDCVLVTLRPGFGQSLAHDGGTVQNLAHAARER